MMTLPKFTDKNPSIEKLWEEQSRLKRQTEKLVLGTGIFEIFSRYGDLSPIGGSYKYDLMVYPDIDIDVVSIEIDKQKFAELVREMVSSKFVRKVSTADTVNFEAIQKGRPKGYWIGLEILFEGERWGVDCWLQHPDWTLENKDIYTKRLSELDDTGKSAILLIKYDLIRQGTYGKTVFSTDVYNAVLDQNIRTATEFNQFIHQNNA